MDRRTFLTISAAVVGAPALAFESGVPNVPEMALEDYIGKDLWLTTFDIAGFDPFIVLIHKDNERGIDSPTTLAHAGAVHVVDMKTNTAVYKGGTTVHTHTDKELLDHAENHYETDFNLDMKVT